MGSKKGINPLILVGAGGVVVYLLTRSSSTTTQQSSSNLLSNLIPQATNQVPTTYGINSGQRGGNGSFYTVSNYMTLLQYNPNLGNPNYQLTQAERQQYLNNYQDLRTGLATWVGVKQPDGNRPGDIYQAAQEHWHFYGCSEQRIFLPLQPPSTAAYIPPPVNPKASSQGSGSSWVTTALSTAGSLAVALLGLEYPERTQLNDAEANILITGSAIIKKILPFYLQVDAKLVASIENKVDALVSAYSD